MWRLDGYLWRLDGYLWRLDGYLWRLDGYLWRLDGCQPAAACRRWSSGGATSIPSAAMKVRVSPSDQVTVTW
jgi:hypothetical protein